MGSLSHILKSWLIWGGILQLNTKGRNMPETEKKEAYSIVLPKDTFKHLQGQKLEVILSPWIGLDGIVICKNEGPEEVSIELERVD